jgi:antitoxin (DNA-binding transcriptional repressor) of toxin-antitoxin stability system
MRSVGVREFRDKATSLMSMGETLVIERHGRPIGFFIPIKPKDPVARKKAADELHKTIQDILAKTGMTEDELAAEWDRLGRER